MSAIGYGITADSAGNIYGIGMGTAAQSHWVVRKLAAGLPPPSLSTSRSGNTLSLTWPIYASDFVLQSATTLANIGDWQDATNAPTEINGQKVVTITPTGSRGFFRLRGP